MYRVLFNEENIQNDLSPISQFNNSIVTIFLSEKPKFNKYNLFVNYIKCHSKSQKLSLITCNNFKAVILLKYLHMYH